jgi:RND family efflux transporter MFP subunit
LGATTVFADEKSAIADAEHRPSQDPSAIAYLKEQQWTNTFATEPIREAELRSALRAPAIIQPLTGGDAIVSAPASGRFSAEALLAIGQAVKAGQSLGRIEPRLTTGIDRATLDADLAEAQAAVDAARVEEERAVRLLAERAVPARRVEDAKRALAVAEARARAALARQAQHEETVRTGGGAASGNSFALRAPIGGRVVAVMATRGASYDEGAPLFRIVRTDQVELQALIPAADVSLTRNVDSIALDLPGETDPVVVKPRHRHDSGVIDPITRALTVQFEVDNPRGQLLIGQTATAAIYTKARQRVPAAPKSAVLMEAGRPYVFVQLTGERFARRFVEISARDGDLIGLKSGVKPGERVVTRGAYEVQLASAAKGLPAEGHVH